ncbi:hypothetical protein PHMEG_00016156 [Phytophthora megakarya]|uniref:Reverse transcriptase n=1 Tax=Phytophthora megakarya TaxID=4795 RepID=A0A225W0K7_9STRA|nr:hypothetical protein PHMEG_00016156 [Phytophthora megakarya]
MIRHDRDTRFMDRVFKHFRDMFGSRERVTLAYRPHRTTGDTVDQSDWEELAEKLMWAQNTSFDFTRVDTPFYLVHGWDAQGTVEAMMGDFPRDGLGPGPPGKGQKRRAEDHNRKWKQLTDRLKEGFEVGDTKWKQYSMCAGSPEPAPAGASRNTK